MHLGQVLWNMIIAKHSVQDSGLRFELSREEDCYIRGTGKRYFSSLSVNEQSLCLGDTLGCWDSHGFWIFRGPPWKQIQLPQTKKNSPLVLRPTCGFNPILYCYSSFHAH